MKTFKQALAAAALVGALALAGAASADTYTLTQSDAFGSGNFGSVTVTGTSTDLHFVVNLNSPYQLIDSGAHFLFAGNLSGSNFALVGPAGMTLSTGSISNAPFQGFDFGINCNTACGPGSSGPYGSSLIFDITGTGLGVLDASPFNGQDIKFAADVTNGSGVTGVVGGPGGPVPEPATWALMITGIGLAGAMLRRRNGLAALTQA
jgi:hypothetical protein